MHYNNYEREADQGACYPHVLSCVISIFNACLSFLKEFESFQGSAVEKQVDSKWVTSGRASPSPSICLVSGVQMRGHAIRRTSLTRAQQPWLTLLSSHKCLKWDILWRHLLPTKKLHACKYTHGHAGENKNKGSLHLWCHILVGTLLCVWELKLRCTGDPICLLIDLTC